MPNNTYKVYAYRWIILAVFMLVNLVIQMMWICYAPITGPAATFYGVSEFQIGLLAMIFMIIYIPLSLPISWVIDTLGYRKSVSIGVLLLGVFGLTRGIFAANYTWVVISTIGLAIGQPFLMNSITTVAAKWFPIQERATASGLALVASFLGIGVGQVLSPILVVSYSIPTTMLIYGIVAMVSALLFLAFTREAPPTPPCPPGQELRALMLDGLKTMIKMKDIWVLLGLFLIGMGVFNGVSTWIEGIVSPKGFSITESGDMGGFLLIGGIIGAAVIPALSDKLRKRKAFLLIGMLLVVPCLLGVTYAVPYWFLAFAMFALGFCLMSLAPIGYQYAAEITFPAPEGTSNGLMNLAGQISVVFVYAMEALKTANGSFTFSLIFLTALTLASGLSVLMIKESTFEAHLAANIEI